MSDASVSASRPDGKGSKGPPPVVKSGFGRYHLLPRPVKVIFILTNVAAVLLFIAHWWAFPIFGRVLSGTAYYYLLFALLAFNIPMGLAATQAQKKRSPRWFDYILGITLLSCLFFFLLNSDAISMRQWEPPPSWLHFTLALITAGISVEMGRRIGGWGYVGLLSISVLYPLVADKMPGVFFGFRLSFPDIMADFAFGANGILGLPAHIFGELILGFYLFAGVIGGMGAGDFFLKLSVALMGRFRGGPAKISVLSSAFFGTLSGSILANIVSDGNYTIPAMKRMGFSPTYAAAIEACASTGGPITPPILGGMAFTGAIIGGYDYTTIMIAAVIPALLYFFGMLVQVDSYAARIGIKGLPREEIPSLLPVLRDGWIYLLCIAFLTVGMVYFRWGEITPIYTAVLMGLLSFTSKKTRLTWNKLVDALSQAASLVNFGVGIFLSMGLMLVGLYKTGVAGAITTWVIGLGAGNLYLILLVGVVFNLVMGMVGLESSAFLFLAVVMAPAVASVGNVPLVAVHLFLICYSILGGLTPPVAINAFVAASIAGSPPQATGWVAFRLAIVLLFVPFFFVLQPALILQAPIGQILYHLSFALIGVAILSSCLEGYMVGVGKLTIWERGLAGLGGFLIAFPEWQTTVAGFALAGAIIALGVIRRRALKPRPRTT